MVVLTKEPFGTFEGEPVTRFTWKTANGLSVSVISYGAIIQSIKVPDRNGAVKDVVLGFDDLQSYTTRNTPHLGAAIGRCANRIGKATFDIDGVSYKLAKNIGENHLHGGIRSFDKVNWKSNKNGQKVTFSYLSKDGEEGYPGDLLTNITYELLDDGNFHVEYLATTTKKTIVNLTNHSYFNLAGHDAGAQELYNHVVTINADRITETDADSIPTGKLVAVGGTAYDLRVPSRLAHVMEKKPGLFDDNFCVTSFGNKDLNFVSRVEHPCGRSLEIYCNQPGVQFYTANFLPAPSDSALVGKSGEGYRRHGAFCLETQIYPDAVHHDNFPSPVLVPGELYKHVVVYKFGVAQASSPTVVSA
ncbi:galactose mutarotase [Plodia interpunctella]|uniref:galactose mutarotase n=1 Tax=Plodia interpunctella TaxID=58824 RepID=UPI002367C894|nr:galactose mutarotase [Plodia interpunctella]XP_053616505.1 galactose mutarotase [Plodia interpunctella]